MYNMNRDITACKRTNFAMSKIQQRKLQQCSEYNVVVKAHLFEEWPELGHMISDALYTSLLYDAAIDVEMMKIADCNESHHVHGWFFADPHTLGTIRSVEERRCGRRKLEMDDIRINID